MNQGWQDRLVLVGLVTMACLLLVARLASGRRGPKLLVGFATAAIPASGFAIPHALLSGLFVALLLSPSAQASAQFVTGPEAETLRRLIPLEEFRDDPDVRIYNRRSMPRAYQMPFDHPYAGAHSVFHNISGETPEKYLPDGNGGNWGIDFPWNTPGGLHACTNTKHFSFVKFAGGPCVWWKGTLTHRWMFPEGTIFGEVLTVAGPEGDYPFECRVKERRLDGWSARVFRPFPTREHLLAAIELVEPNSPALAQLRQTTTVGYRALVDAHHHAPTLKSRAAEFVLPDLSPDLVKQLLTRFRFDEATGTTFEGDCFAPTSRQAFSIVPGKYMGNHLGSSDESCRQCHRVAGFDGDRVDLRSPKQKYGHIPGDDEILSFHPFHPQCISQNGFPLRVALWGIPGVIERFDPSRHTADRYRRLSP